MPTDLAMPDEQWAALERTSETMRGVRFSIAETPNPPPAAVATDDPAATAAPTASTEASQPPALPAEDLDIPAVAKAETDALEISGVDRTEQDELAVADEPPSESPELQSPSAPDEAPFQQPFAMPDIAAGVNEDLELPAATGPQEAVDHLESPSIPDEPVSPMERFSQPNWNSAPDLEIPSFTAMPLPSLSSEFQSSHRNRGTEHLPVAESPPSSAFGILAQSQAPTIPGEGQLTHGYVPLDGGGDLFTHPAAAGVLPEGGFQEDDLSAQFAEQLDGLRERMLERTSAMIEEQSVLAELRETDW